jgi:hypothetical protein
MRNGMALHCRSLSLCRGGNSLAEYEDAYAADAERGRFAISDGAAASSFAGLWARLLVEGFVKLAAPEGAVWTAWLPALQQRWNAEASAALDGGQALPWFTLEKLAEGAFAAFLGLVVEQTQSAGGRWQAVAVGDSCLFHICDGRLHRAFPLTRAAEFNNSPWLVGARDNPAADLHEKEARAEGDWRAADCFWLMTDALAQWFLGDAERGNKPWETLDGLVESPTPQQSFAAWIDTHRTRRELRNDDVTLVRVRPAV